MSLPTPPPFSEPIPNPSPTVPNVPEEHIVKGPYWSMKIADSGITVTSDGQVKRTGSTTSYPSSATTEIKGSTGHFSVGDGLSVVDGDIFQVGAGSGTLDYYIETSQGHLILGNGFYVDPSTGNLLLD
jgi:hypothetical protein